MVSIRNQQAGASGILDFCRFNGRCEARELQQRFLLQFGTTEHVGVSAVLFPHVSTTDRGLGSPIQGCRPVPRECRLGHARWVHRSNGGETNLLCAYYIGGGKTRTGRRYSQPAESRPSVRKESDG